MKRYALFEFDQYYPGGGWSDLAGLFDSIEDAVSHYRAPRPRLGEELDYGVCDFYQVVDLRTGEIVRDDGDEEVA